MSYLLSKPIFKELISTIIAILLSLIVGGIIFSACGADPFMAYVALVRGAVIGEHQIAETLVKMCPLLFAGLGIAIAFKCGIWNIGAEGQIIVGALFAAWLGFAITGLPAIIHIPLIMMFSFLGGAGWAAIPAILKVKINANEILTTLILNYIAYWISVYLIFWPLDDPVAYTPQTPHIFPSATLPRLILGTRCHTGILLAIFCGILLQVIMKKTILGYEIKVVGANPASAKIGGINVAKTIILAMLISGGLAGLGGMVEVIGRDFFLRDEATTGYGFLSIAVALVGNLNPIGVIFSSFFFGALKNGADLSCRAMNISPVVAYAIAGATILFILIKDFILSLTLKLPGMSRGAESI